MAKGAFLMQTINTGWNAARPGTTLQAALVPAVNGLLAFSVACATAAIAVAVAQFLLRPGDEQALQTVTRVRRILTVCAFLAGIASVAIGLDWRAGDPGGGGIQSLVSGIGIK